MPTPLTPTSSQEIVAISPPPATKRRKIDYASTSIPKPAPVRLDRDLREKVEARVREYERKERTQNGEGKLKGKEQVARERERMEGVSRSRVTERMVCGPIGYGKG